jgi:hypothetical protein
VLVLVLLGLRLEKLVLQVRARVAARVAINPNPNPNPKKFSASKRSTSSKEVRSARTYSAGKSKLSSAYLEPSVQPYSQPSLHPSLHPSLPPSRQAPLSLEPLTSSSRSRSGLATPLSPNSADEREREREGETFMSSPHSSTPRYVKIKIWVRVRVRVRVRIRVRVRLGWGNPNPNRTTRYDNPNPITNPNFFYRGRETRFDDNNSLSSLVRQFHEGDMRGAATNTTAKHVTAFHGHPDYKWDQEVMLKRAFKLLCTLSMAVTPMSTAHTLIITEPNELGELIYKSDDLKKLLRFTVFGSWIKRKQWALFTPG